jgi:hypothetical protein
VAHAPLVFRSPLISNARSINSICLSDRKRSDLWRALLATGCSPVQRYLLNPRPKGQVARFFALLVGGQRLPLGMFD